MTKNMVKTAHNIGTRMGNLGSATVSNLTKRDNTSSTNLLEIFSQDCVWCNSFPIISLIFCFPIDSIGGSKGVPGTPLVQFLSFLCRFLETIGQIISWSPPPSLPRREILDPPLDSARQNRCKTTKKLYAFRWYKTTNKNNWILFSLEQCTFPPL